jgi:hypothetical protein
MHKWDHPDPIERPVGACAGFLGTLAADFLSVQRESSSQEVVKTVRLMRSASDVRALSAVALASGGVSSPHPVNPEGTGKHISWDISGKCQSPWVIEHHGQGHYEAASAGALRVAGAVWEPNRFLALRVPCRQCGACLKQRRIKWGDAAVSEFRTATRSWFGTLTIAPELRYRLKAAAAVRLMASGDRLEGLEPLKQFQELHREAGPLVTRFLYRLRSGARHGQGVRQQVRFRFLLTAEPHADWFPHFHILVHEISELMPIRERVLSAQWPHGHCKWRLVKDERAARYVAKYLGKFSMARVRASKEYGRECETVAQRTTF